MIRRTAVKDTLKAFDQKENNFSPYTVVKRSNVRN